MDARRSLETSLQEARRLKMTGVQLDLRLAQGELELSADAASARAQLQSVELDAQHAGFLLVAAKAARLQRLR